jgi:hypothetical protein
MSLQDTKILTLILRLKAASCRGFKASVLTWRRDAFVIGNNIAFSSSSSLLIRSKANCSIPLDSPKVYKLCLLFILFLLSIWRYFFMPLFPVESICNLRILISHMYKVLARCPAGITIKITYFYLFERNVRFLYSFYTSTQHLK